MRQALELQLQWQSELRSKFNEEFEILDGAALQYLGRGGRNPWTARPNVICSLPVRPGKLPSRISPSS